LPYFLCLDAKKVTKKNQGKPDRSALFALPSPHISYSIKICAEKKNTFFTILKDQADQDNPAVFILRTSHQSSRLNS